jgi:hypothetical protein
MDYYMIAGIIPFSSQPTLQGRTPHGPTLQARLKKEYREID